MPSILNTSSGALPANSVDAALPVASRGSSGSGVGQMTHGARQFLGWLGRGFTFWTVVPIIGLVGFVYLYGYTDSLYQSSAIVTLQNNSSTSTSLSTVVGSSLFGSTAGATQSGAVLAYIQSPDLMRVLDKKFHLRQIYSAAKHSPFWRLDPDASDEDFLSFYQQMVTVTQDSTTFLITINVLDYDAQRARTICNFVVAQSQKFVNGMSAVMANATLKYAKDQLKTAMNWVETAQPYERPVAEMELTAAQQGLVSAESLANQQQTFLITVDAANLPTDTTDPDRLVDEAMILLGASLIFMIAHLLLANVRDHRHA